MGQRAEREGVVLTKVDLDFGQGNEVPVELGAGQLDGL